VKVKNRRATARKARAVLDRPPPLQGWRTTDADEVALRRWRGRTEIVAIEELEPKQPIFGAFRVQSGSGSFYEVEIRSLDGSGNSCGCIDHRANGLGTCKHVEGVLAALQQRGAKIAAAHREARMQAMETAAFGWDSSPVSLARLSAELWDQIKTEDWSLVSWQGFVSGWPGRLWDFDKHYRYIGGQGAGAMGYGAPAAVGAALANRKHGRLSINIQTDGDLNYAPGVLWTACHHKIPLLTVMHNNRAYHQEVMFVQQMASERNRGADRAHIGTTLREPNIDYAKMAQAYGMYGEGPIENPKDLAPAIKRALDRVKRGEPALLDVITQPR